jgi:hypothetical protein
MLDYDREVVRCDATSDGDAGERGHQGRATRASAATRDGDAGERGHHGRRRTGARPRPTGNGGPTRLPGLGGAGR